MKNQLTLVLVTLSTLVTGQSIEIFQEQSLNINKNVQTIGVQITNKKGFGVYLSGGANVIESMIGLNNQLDIETESTLSGQTWWFTTPGDHVGLNMTEYNQNGLWSSPQYNNQFIDNTTYRATVRSIFTENKIQHKVLNIGMVVPVKGKVFRIGGGLYNNVQKGEVTTITSSTVKKVDLYWETNLESYHIIYTHNSISEKVENKVIDENSTIMNINLSLQLNKYLTVGYDSQVGLNVGLIYNL